MAKLRKERLHIIVGEIWYKYVGAQFIGALPIYRPWKHIEGPLADKSTKSAMNRPLRAVDHASIG